MKTNTNQKPASGMRVKTAMKAGIIAVL